MQQLTKKFASNVALNCLSMMGVSFYVLADTLFIAHYVGTTGLTALNLILPMYFILISGPAIMLGVGGGAFFSMALGQRHFRQARRYFHTALLTLAGFIILITLVTLCSRHQIVYLLGARAEAVAPTLSYYTVMMSFTPAFMLNQLSLSFVRNDDNSKLSTIAMVTSNIGNVIGDYILMDWFHLGMTGAALATGISPVISLLIQSLHWRKEDCHLQLRPFEPMPASSLSILRTGIPAYINDASSGIIVLIFNLTILPLAGNMGIAAYGIIANLNIVVVALFNGIGMGTQPLASFAYGADDKTSLQFLRRASKLTAFVLGTVILGFGYLYTDWLVSLFNTTNDATLQALGREGLRLYFLAYCFTGVNMCEITYLAATIKALPSTVFSISRSLILPLGVVLMAALWQMTGLWLTIPLTELLTFAMSLIYQLYHHRKTNILSSTSTITRRD